MEEPLSQAAVGKLSVAFCRGQVVNSSASAAQWVLWHPFSSAVVSENSHRCICKWVGVAVFQESFIYENKCNSLSLTLWDPMDCTVHGTLQARILEWVGFAFSRGFSQPRDRTQVSCIAGRFFTSWATGKSTNSGVGSLFLLHKFFLTQESNWCLLCCRQILYHLSYQGSPTKTSGGPDLAFGL